MTASVPSAPLDIKAILKILPHRYPFLLVDRVLEMNLETGHLLAQKNVTINEGFFQGHFPTSPIMPGVLILEALAQAGGILVHLQNGGDDEKIAILLSVKEAKFRKPVKPGDTLLLKCEGQHSSSKGGRVKATALVDDKICAEADIHFVFVNKHLI